MIQPMKSIQCILRLNFPSHCRFVGNLSQIETLVLNVSGRILMVNKENNGNASENLVSCITFTCVFLHHTVDIFEKKIRFLRQSFVMPLHYTVYYYYFLSFTVVWWSVFFFVWLMMAPSVQCTSWCSWLIAAHQAFPMLDWLARTVTIHWKWYRIDWYIFIYLLRDACISQCQLWH